MSLTILSQASSAQVHATNLQSGGHQLSGIAQAEADTQTTVAGNTKAQEVLELSKTARSSITEAMIGMVTNLNQVVEGFEAADQDAAKIIKI